MLDKERDREMRLAACGGGGGVDGWMDVYMAVYMACKLGYPAQQSWALKKGTNGWMRSARKKKIRRGRECRRGERACASTQQFLALHRVIDRNQPTDSLDKQTKPTDAGWLGVCLPASSQ